MNNAKLGFELRKVRLPVPDILPLRQVKDPQHNIERYRMIRSSLKEVGLVEPLVVFPQANSGKYLLLDGHLRLVALKELGEKEADCLVATEDECFTYNARVNRLNPISEHKMIMKAVNNGVSPERISAALNLPLKDVKAIITLLDGINDEAVELLKDKPISPKAIWLMRKVTGVRQIEIAELMVSANNYTKPYAEALVLSTPKDQLTNPEEPKQKKGMSREELAKLQVEMQTIERDMKAVEETYGEDMLNLTLARGYIKKLLANARVCRFLTANHPDLMSEFESIGAVETV